MLGKDLFTVLEGRSFRPLSDTEARSVMIQLLDAVRYCHQQNVVHLDIKLDNIMMDEDTGKVTLIDFGLCDFMDYGDRFNRRVGREEYCPAEILSVRISKDDSPNILEGYQN